ncbi:EG45-like domain containing protein [Hevea brasiliensis]|nr:EG45-like domain containing protein [Hevea brasiliensis]
MKFMGMLIQMVMMVSIAGCLATVAYAAEGTATYYTPPYVPSACYGYENKGVMIAAASDALWNNRAACGKRYRVRCIGATNQGIPQPCKSGSVVVTIVDYCPPGCQGTIDLSQEAFSQIADPNAGKIRIQYTPA